MTFYRVDLGRHARFWLAYRQKALDVAKAGSREYMTLIKVFATNVDFTQNGQLAVLNGNLDLELVAAFENGKQVGTIQPEQVRGGAVEPEEAVRIDA